MATHQDDADVLPNSAVNLEELPNELKRKLIYLAMCSYTLHIYKRRRKDLCLSRGEGAQYME